METPQLHSGNSGSLLATLQLSHTPLFCAITSQKYIPLTVKGEGFVLFRSCRLCSIKAATTASVSTVALPVSGPSPQP